MGKRILLIEENDQLYRALREALQDAGAEVIGAVAFMPGGSAIHPLARTEVAIVDTGRASRSIALVRDLRQRDIPCVLVAAEPPPSLCSGAVQCLSKPFTEDQLLDCVCAAMRAGRTSTQSPAAA